MTRDEAWTALTLRGVDYAVVQFSGGNDEGGADAITLTRQEGDTLVKVAELRGWSDVDRDSPEDEALGDALEGPVRDSYGGFAGEFWVNGTVTWDVTKREIRQDADERSSGEDW